MTISKLKFLIVFCTLSLSSYASVDDSTGVILKDGKVFILHKVENGQGIFGVARRYKVDWTRVKEANPGSDSKLLPGQTLLVPTGKTEKQFFGNKAPNYSKIPYQYSKPIHKTVNQNDKKTDKPVVENSNKETFTFSYTIKKGETLFSVANKFKTTSDFLIQLNKLSTDKLDEGKQILVPISNANDAALLLKEKEMESEKIKTEIDETSQKLESEKNRLIPLPDTAKPAVMELEHKSIPVEKPETKLPKSKIEYTITTENFPEYDVEKVTETGIGKLTNDPKINQTKDWVIHHNAPENTIILITNPVNNKTIYAKVVKNFKRAENDPLIIFITKNTADYLELSKKDKFNIKLSFAK